MASDRTYWEEGKTLAPMEAVMAFRDLKRERKDISARDKELITQEQELDSLIRTYVESGLLAQKMSKLPGGGTVFQKSDIYASVKADTPPEVVRAAFKAAGWEDLIKPGVNTNSLKARIKSALDDDELKSIEERAAGIPSELRAILNISEVPKTQANGL